MLDLTRVKLSLTLTFSLITLMLTSVKGQGTSSTANQTTDAYITYLTANYDNCLPPYTNQTNSNFDDCTNDFYQMFIIERIQPNFKQSTMPKTQQAAIQSFILIINMFQFMIVEEEWMWWKDYRLVFQNDNRFSASVKSNYIDITDKKHLFWTPWIKYHDQKSQNTVDTYLALLADGTIISYKKSESVYQCKLDFQHYPNDTQFCNITINIKNFNYSVIKLNAAQYQFDPRQLQTGQNKLKNKTNLQDKSKGLIWTAQMKESYEFIRYSETDDNYASALTFQLILDRNPYPYSVTFVFQTCLLILISYCTFWLSKFAVTARIYLAINTVIISTQSTANFLNSSILQKSDQDYHQLPTTDQLSWLEVYMRGIMVFSIMTMLQFVFLNFCTTQYIYRRDNILAIISEIRENLAKVKKKFMKQQSERKIKNALALLLERNRLIRQQQTKLKEEKEQIEENMMKRKITQSKQGSTMSVNLGTRILSLRQNSRLNVNTNNSSMQVNSQTQNSQLYGSKNLITQQTDMDSDMIDHEFNIEEEKSQNSRQGSFFTQKRQELEKLKATSSQNSPPGAVTVSIHVQQLSQSDSSSLSKLENHSSSEASASHIDDYLGPLQKVRWGIKEEENEDDEDDGQWEDQDSSDKQSGCEKVNGYISESSSDDSIQREEEEEKYKEVLEMQVKKQRQEEERIKEEIDNELYQKRLTRHINELEEAQKDSNPARFQIAFDSFKVFVVQHWTQIDYDLDSKTRKQIVEVFEIENSGVFKFYRFLSNNLDYFTRFAYASCFLFFMCLNLSDLYEQPWLEIASIILFVASIFVWILIHLLIRKRKSDLTFMGAVRWYLKCFCIFGKKKKRALFQNKEKKKKVK